MYSAVHKYMYVIFQRIIRIIFVIPVVISPDLNQWIFPNVNTITYCVLYYAISAKSKAGIT